MNNQTIFKQTAFIIGVSLVIGLSVLAIGVSSIRKTNNTLSTTGSYKMRVVSDFATWNFTVSRNVTEQTLLSGYPLLEQDSNKVKEYLLKNGVLESELDISTVFTDEVWNYENNNQPRRFVIRQNFKIESNDIEKITALSKNTTGLAGTGVFFVNQAPEYFVSNLSELRVSLLGKALEDARARANEIAKGAGNRVGKLSSASSGVVQVLSPNSLEIADYGAYNTNTPEKDVQVTVRATFKIK